MSFQLYVESGDLTRAMRLLQPVFLLAEAEPSWQIFTFFFFLTLSHTHYVAKGEDGLQPLLLCSNSKYQAYRHVGHPLFLVFKEREGKQASIFTELGFCGEWCAGWTSTEQHPLSPGWSLETVISKPCLLSTVSGHLTLSLDGTAQTRIWL